jgi:hypothetical protein
MCRLARRVCARFRRILEPHQPGIVGEHCRGLHRPGVREFHLVGIEAVRDHVRLGYYYARVVTLLGLGGSETQRWRVALVPVHEQDPLCAGAAQAATDVGDDRRERTRCERQCAGPGQVIGRDSRQAE